MKKTQMIHSPRTFKLGLGLMLAAGLMSAPLLTGASETAKKPPAKHQNPIPATTNTERGPKLGESESKGAGKPEAPKASHRKMKTKPAAEAKTKAKPVAKPVVKTKPSESEAAQGRAAARTRKLEGEAKRIAATLTPTQRAKLLALLNEAETDELAAIGGLGKSRSIAIEKARPLSSIEDLPKVKGVGMKTLTEVVDHGKNLTKNRGAATGSKNRGGKSPAAKSGKSGKSVEPGEAEPEKNA